MAWSSTGTDIPQSNVPASTILFCLNGQTTIRQIEEVETTETRGLTEAAATALAGVTDNTTQTAYYALINGTVYQFTATTGTKTEVSAARADDSDQWVATERVTTYSITPSSLPNVWGTTELNANGETIALSSGGTSSDISIDYSSSRLWVYNNHPVNQTIRTVVTEVKYIDTQAHANALVTANTSDNLSDTTVKQNGTYTLANGTTETYVCAWCTVKTGTEKFASARYVSAKEGWLVTITTKTYGYNATGWYV